jgi:transposase-like protein
MPQNPIQFQPGMSLDEFFDQYGTEAQCEAALERARWPEGFVCPRCGGTAHSTFLVDGHKVWQCSQCRAQTTLRSGTLFHGSKLPLRKWFQAIYLVTQNKNNISALSLMRHLGICYRSAWRLKHKLMEAMAEREAPRTLSGTVVADDACLGGAHAGKPGRGSQNKAWFMAAVELTEENHPIHIRFDPLPDLTGRSIAAWAKAALQEGAHLLPDALASLAAAAPMVAAYGAIVLGEKKASELEVFRWVNTFISNLKRAIDGTYHHIDVHKYRARYLAEAQYRVNRRFDLRSLVKRLVVACVHTEPSPEHWLRLGIVRSS